MRNSLFKNRSIHLIFILFLIGVLISCKDESNTNELIGKDEQEHNYYKNPVINTNFPDPTLIKAADGYYYVYATNSDVNGKFVNIQVRRSKDMVHWENLGDALSEKPDWADTDFWAPHVIYDKNTEKYYLYYSGESNKKNIGKCLGVAVSDSPAGPFIDKEEPLLCGEGFVNIDPMAFDDPVSDKKYLYWGSGFGSIKVRELSDDRLNFKKGSEIIELIEPVTSEDPLNYENLVEGVWVIKRGSFYYLFYSGDNCCGDRAHYAVMVARSKNPTGPFEKFKNEQGRHVILSKNETWLAPGHNSVIEDESGQYWIIYHAINASFPEKGRLMLMDRMEFKNGWPRILRNSPSTNKEIAPITK